MKKCIKCGIEKSLSEFHKDRSQKDGHRNECKTCRNEYFTRYRQKNKDKIAEKNSRYYQKNKDKIAEKGARYYQENKEKSALYYQENKDRFILYYQKNKEKIAEKGARYYQENKDKIAEKNSRYYKETKANEPACIYQIKNKQNGKIYIGETLRGKLRWIQHLASLRGGYHGNKSLQEDFDEFGEEVFEWEILKELPKNKEALLLEEVRTINKFLKEDKELYNLSLTIEQLKLLQENEE